jgi:hypothetical protein
MVQFAGPPVNGMATPAAWPTAAMWICDAVPVTPVVVTEPDILRVSGSKMKTPVPVAVDPVPGVSCAPVRVAKNTWRPICPRISPLGFAAVCTFTYRLPLRRLSTCDGVRMVPVGTVQVPPSPLLSGMMTGEALPTGPSWMCATVPSMLVVVTLPEMALVDGSIEKDALPVAKVVTAGVSCAPFSDVLLSIAGGPPPPPSPPQEDTSMQPHNAPASHTDLACMGASHR